VKQRDDKLRRLRRAIEDLAAEDCAGAVNVAFGEGADVNGRDECGQTPLIWACMFGNQEAVRLLIEAGADVNAVDEMNKTVLMYGVEAGRHDILAMLVAQGAEGAHVDDDKRNALHYAADTWATNFDDPAEEKRYFELLLSTGMDINAKDKDGETALTLAGDMDRPAVIEVLKARGAK
jgi:ankyrin repeat protein